MFANLSAAQNDQKLLKVTLKDQSKFVGYSITAGKDKIDFFNLKANQSLEFERTSVEHAVPVTFDEAVKVAGLPSMFGWKIQGLAKQMSQPGKVAKVNSQLVYVTLGSRQGMRKSAKLTVFRNEGEIVDPDTGKVLAVERPKIAELEVVEVSDSYSKAKITGDLEAKIKVGDEIEVDSKVTVAVAPIAFEDGSVNSSNALLVEDLITTLVNREVSVVDRSNMATVVNELLAQKTVLFDPDSAQKLGKLTGASHVVVGKVIPTSKTRGTAYVRLVEVETGKVIVASTASVSVTGVSSSGGQSRGSKLKSLKRLPGYMVTRSRYQKTDDGGVRIQGSKEFTIDKQGAVQTKEIGFVGKDFVFEVVVKFAKDDMVGNVGIGAGLADRSYNGLKDSVYLRLHNPDMRHGGGKVLLNRFKMGEEEIGELATAGPHLVRVSKKGETVTFQVDSGNDGPSDDDFETTISDIKDFAPFLHSKNSPLLK